jgi:hypothetical protein
MSKTAQLFIGAVVLSALASLGVAALRWEVADLVRFAAFLVVAALASRLKLTLPGLTGTMSVSLPFILLAAVVLSYTEAVIIAALATAVQCMPKPDKQFNLVRALFNIGTMVNAAGATSIIFQATAQNGNLVANSLALCAAAATLLVADTVPVAAIISITEHANAAKVWREMMVLTFPYFVLSAGLVAIASSVVPYAGWWTLLFGLPVMFGIYRSFQMYFARAARESVAIPMAATAVGHD